MAILSVLFALLLVSVPSSREYARQQSCQNNLKQLALSLHNYHDTYWTLPIGSRGAGDTQSNPAATQDYASSWLISIFPFAEYKGLALWDHEQGNGFNGGDPADPYTNMALIDGYVPDWLRCPSSPLPDLVLQGQHGTPTGRVLPTYVGVAGGVTQAGWPYHDTSRVVTQSVGAKGVLASNGALLPNECIGLDDLLDGTSNTIMVAEQSDMMTVAGKKLMAHSGATVGAWCGAKGNGIVGRNADASNPVAWNLTTIRYGVQSKRHATLPPGIYGPSDTTNLGNNNGIFSAHSGGASAAFGDGRVKFFPQDIDLKVLVYMCIRDDAEDLDLP